jgi:hypothetical protein
MDLLITVFYYGFVYRMNGLWQVRAVYATMAFLLLFIYVKILLNLLMKNYFPTCGVKRTTNKTKNNNNNEVK